LGLIGLDGVERLVANIFFHPQEAWKWLEFSQNA
jgi:hypothetical protein